jgi:hypothetical protein
MEVLEPQAATAATQVAPMVSLATAARRLLSVLTSRLLITAVQSAATAATVPAVLAVPAESAVLAVLAA